MSGRRRPPNLAGDRPTRGGVPPSRPRWCRCLDVAVDGGADGGEEAVVADGVEQPVAAQAVLDRALELGEGQGDALRSQLLEQVAEGVGGGGVDVGDGLGGHHHPADRGGGVVDQAADPAPEVAGVGEEQRGVEAVQEQAGNPAGGRVALDVVVALEVVLAAEDGVVGTPGPADEVADGQQDGHEDADQDPEQGDASERGQPEDELDRRTR